MKKVSLFITATMLISMTGFSQTVKQNIEKLSRDPKTAENAAKADVYITNKKKVISDTSAFIQSGTHSSCKSKGSKRARNKKN